MPISPKEALQSSEDKEIITENEVIIDRILKHKYCGGQIIIQILDNRINQRVKDAIVKDYKAVGWKQAYFNDMKGLHHEFVLSDMEPTGYFDR